MLAALPDDAWAEILGAYVAHGVATRATLRPRHKPPKPLESAYRWALDSVPLKGVRTLGHWREGVHAAVHRMDDARREALLCAAFRRADAEHWLLPCVLPTTDPDLVRRLLATGIPAQGGDPSEVTALHAAVAEPMGSERSPEVFDLLVAAGASVDAGDASGWTPLHLACARGQSEDAADLLRLGADPCVRDHEGRQPIDVVGTRREPEQAFVRANAEARQTELAMLRAMLEAAGFERQLPVTRLTQRAERF